MPTPVQNTTWAEPEGAVIMNNVRLSGQLICKDLDEAAVIMKHLPQHVTLTRNEPGCVSFDVLPTADPLVWDVAEQFLDRSAFHAHQDRIADSEWGWVTAGIERRYVVEDVQAEAP